MKARVDFFLSAVGVMRECENRSSRNRNKSYNFTIRNDGFGVRVYYTIFGAVVESLLNA